VSKLVNRVTYPRPPTTDLGGLGARAPLQGLVPPAQPRLLGEQGIRLVHNMRVGPCIPVEIQL
jgi:hypothetical protein